MTTTMRRSVTLEEFLEKPETKPYSEYACGEVWRKDMPNSAHSRLQLYLAVLLARFLEGMPLGIVGPELRCIFGPSGRTRAYVPDVVYASFDRYPRGDVRNQPYLLAAPELAIEVLSPRQNAARFANKLRFYLRHGVRLVWIVDPIKETVTVHVPDDDEAILRPGDTLDGGDVLPGFSVPIADIFAQLHV
jgi:Uma2 family endonuclease